MATRIHLGDVTVDVIRKDIRNVHLSVYPPSGRVRISAPSRMSLDTIRVFAISKLDWIRAQQKKLRAQELETRREYVNRESHYVWWKRYLLTVVEKETTPSVELTVSRMRLTVRPGADIAKRHAVMEEWYRQQLKEAIPPLITTWESRPGVTVDRFFVQRMRTKWGSCNHRARTIRLNTELAKKPPECLEYIVVHEMAHLIEPTHNERFVAVMDRVMPRWRSRREALNRLPLGGEGWGY